MKSRCIYLFLSDIVATKEKLDRFMSFSSKTLIFEYDLIKSVN